MCQFKFYKSLDHVALKHRKSIIKSECHHEFEHAMVFWKIIQYNKLTGEHD